MVLKSNNGIGVQTPSWVDGGGGGVTLLPECVSVDIGLQIAMKTLLFQPLIELS